LVTAPNSNDSSASALKSNLNGGSLPTDSFLHRLLYRTDLVGSVVFLVIPRHGPRRHRSFLYAYPLPWQCVHRSVPSSGRQFLLTDVVTLSVLRPYFSM
jgi:hypothetical protein